MDLRGEFVAFEGPRERGTVDDECELSTRQVRMERAYGPQYSHASVLRCALRGISRGFIITNESDCMFYISAKLA